MATPEVFYSDRSFLTVGPEEIAWLKAEAAELPRRRARLCAHPAPEAGLHEMIIVHERMAYVRPHRHHGKSESFHILEGEALAVILEEDGRIAQVHDMAAHGSGKPYFYRMPEKVFHTLLIASDWLVFHEATSGPFDPAKTEFPDWAPDGSDPAEADRFVRDLLARARAHLNASAAE
jgi:cupin fold WbuC family metalloprotein